MSRLYGYEEGEECKRSGCKGIIQHHPVENCSCHVHAPCSACTKPRAYCPTCGFEESEETQMNGYIISENKTTGVWRSLELAPLDPTKINWHSHPNTNASMIKEGVYPEGTTMDQVLELVKGTFGGRFEHFGNGKFKYFAYTD